MTMLMPKRMRGGHNAGLSRYLRTSRKNINWESASLPGLHKAGHENPLEVSFGEFESDGKFDYAVFRPSQEAWYVYRSGDGFYQIAQFGKSGDIPVTANRTF